MLDSIPLLRGQIAENYTKMEFHTSNLARNAMALLNTEAIIAKQRPGVTLLGETLAAIRRKGTIEEHVEESRHQLGRLNNIRTELVNRTRQLQWGAV